MFAERMETKIIWKSWKSALLLTKEYVQTKSNFFTSRRWIFNMILSAGCFYIIYGKEGQVFKKNDEF